MQFNFNRFSIEFKFNRFQFNLNQYLFFFYNFFQFKFWFTRIWLKIWFIRIWCNSTKLAAVPGLKPPKLAGGKSKWLDFRKLQKSKTIGILGVPFDLVARIQRWSIEDGCSRSRRTSANHSLAHAWKLLGLKLPKLGWQLEQGRPKLQLGSVRWWLAFLGHIVFGMECCMESSSDHMECWMESLIHMGCSIGPFGWMGSLRVGRRMGCLGLRMVWKLGSIGWEHRKECLAGCHKLGWCMVCWQSNFDEIATFVCT